jgi:hypothetical protein
MVQLRCPVITPVNSHPAGRVFGAARRVGRHASLECRAPDHDVRVAGQLARGHDRVGALDGQGEAAEGEFVG